MKKVVPFLVIFAFIGCKDDLVKKPKHLIDQPKMIDIMYDLSLLEAIKYQNPAVLDSNRVTPKQFIYKKYGVDSLQLAQNNVYYASDYKNYKKMFDEVTKRLENEKKRVEKQIKIEVKKPKLTSQKDKDSLGSRTKKLD